MGSEKTEKMLICWVGNNQASPVAPYFVLSHTNMENGIQYAPENSSPPDSIGELHKLITLYAQESISLDAYTCELEKWLAINKDTWQEKDLYDLFQLSFAN